MLRRIEGEQVGPLQRIAAREHHQRVPEALDLVQQGEPFLGGQLVRVALRLGGSAAVYTGEIARLCSLPDHKQR